MEITCDIALLIVYGQLRILHYTIHHAFKLIFVLVDSIFMFG